MPNTTADLTASQIKKLQTQYDDDKIPLVAICEQYEISYYMLTKLVKARGWKQRGKKIAKQGSLIKRMQFIASQHINALENSLQSDSAKSTSGDRDRDARTLRTILKIVEDLNTLTSNFEQTTNKHEEIAFNAEQRIEIAKRLEALRGSNR